MGIPEEKQFLGTLNAGQPLRDRRDDPAEGNGQSADSDDHGSLEEDRRQFIRISGQGSPA